MKVLLFEGLSNWKTVAETCNEMQIFVKLTVNQLLVKYLLIRTCIVIKLLFACDLEQIEAL